MDKLQALHSFLGSFGVPAYPTTMVPKEATYPRLTYDGAISFWADVADFNISLWDKSESWAPITRKVVEIGQAIGDGGTTVPYDGGLLWVKQGSIFAQQMTDPDPFIRRYILSLSIEYL